MKRRFCIIGFAFTLLALCFITACTNQHRDLYANQYIYWYGRIADASASQCYAYNIGTGAISPLGIEGYCIEGDGERALFVLAAEDAWSNTVRIAQYVGKQRHEDICLEFPEVILRLYAKKQNWVYYADGRSSDTMTIHRINARGEVQNYSLYPYIQTGDDLVNLVYSVNDDGTIAFLSRCYAKGWPNEETLTREERRICMCRPNEGAFVIESVGQARCPIWVGTDKLFYLDGSSFAVSYLSVSADENGGYTASAESAPIVLKGITSLALSKDGRYLAYQRQDGLALPEPSQWQKIAFFPLDDQATQITTPKVFIDDSFCAWPSFLLLSQNPDD